jgi:hypothetical protein
MGGIIPWAKTARVTLKGKGIRGLEPFINGNKI